MARIGRGIDHEVVDFLRLAPVGGTVAVQEEHLVLELLASAGLLEHIHELDTTDTNGGVPRLLGLPDEARVSALARRGLGATRGIRRG